MKNLVVVVLLFMLPFQVYSLTMGEAIDRAGQQRMLSQRMAQLYVLKGIQPKSERHQVQLSRAINQFEENLNKIKGFKEASIISPHLNNIISQWSQYKLMVSSEPSKTHAKEVLDRSNRILPLLHSYVQKLQGLSNDPGAELVNISGRQRMLSQRIAKNYLANYWQVQNGDGMEQFYQDLAEFQTMLDYLKSSDINTSEISRNLMKTEGHFKFASKGFDGDMALKGDRLVFVITGTTDTMLRNMDVITKQYAAQVSSSDVAVR